MKRISTTRKSSFPAPARNRSRINPRWNRRRIEDVCWHMLTTGYLNCEDIIYPVVPFEESDKDYVKYIVDEPQLSIKMGVKF